MKCIIDKVVQKELKKIEGKKHHKIVSLYINTLSAANTSTHLIIENGN